MHKTFEFTSTSIILFFSIVCENLAVISMWGGDWYDFYIVEKENDPSPDAEDPETQKLVEVV